MDDLDAYFDQIGKKFSSETAVERRLD